MKNYAKLFGIIAIVTVIGFSMAGCNNDPDPGNGKTGGGAETGLYMGINGFNENVTNRQIGLLNTGNKTQFQGFIDNLTMKPATGLYYAVDNAIDKLQSATLPNDLVNVSVVTFTDGLDNASTAIKPNYSSRDAYRDAVSARLRSTKIKNLNISAYSIGVKGGDVADTVAFSAGLTALASNANHAKEVTSMTEVESTFVQIANSLYSESQSQSVRLRLSGGYDDGNKIRFTFDNVTDAATSTLYIEGTFRRSGTDRSLQTVTYQGLSSSSGTTVSGESSGVYVYFTFENISTSGGNISMNNVQQWEYIQAQTRWQRNSEFGGAGDTETIVDRKSAVIMLVLDCTTSLNADGANGFSQMKTAAKNFIDVLVGGGTRYTVTFNANGGSGTVQPMSANSGSCITLPNGIVLSRTGYTFGGWNTNSAGTGTTYNAGASYTVTGNVTLYAKWNSGSSGTTVPSAPTGVTASRNPAGSTTITVSWNAVSGATGYMVYYSGTGSDSGNLEGSPSGTTFDSTSNSTTGTHYFRVSAVNSTGEGSPSSWVSVGPVSGGSSGTETNPILLTAGTWANGSITSTASAVWYSFSVTSGTTYYVWWNGGYTGFGDGTKTLDIKTSAYYSNGTAIFTAVNQGWTSPRSFTASSSGTVKIKVEPYSGGTGTFAVAYRTTSSRP